MEENRFSVKVKLEKGHYRDFACIQKKKAKIWLIFLICALAVMTLCTYVLVNYNQAVGATTVQTVITYALFCCWLFYGELMGDAIYRKQQGQLETYCFGEMRFSVRTEQIDYTAGYQTLSDMYENDRIFALFHAPNAAYIIPKACFAEGEAAAFRSFIEEKTGKKIKLVRNYDLKALRIVIAVLLFVLLFVLPI